MIRHSQSQPHGVALIVVLCTMVVVMVAVVGVVQLVSACQLSRSVQDRMNLADELLLALEAPIQYWLNEVSPRVVLHSLSEEPRVNLLHDIVLVNDVEVEVAIAAWDQLGMAPLEMIAPGSPLRSQIEPEIIAVIENCIPADVSHPGLDQWAQGLGTLGGARVFPKSTSSAIQVFGDAEGTSRQRPADVPEYTTSVGARVATHNNSPPRINIHTAPAPLLEQAYRELGRGGFEAVLAARDRGQATALRAGVSRARPTQRGLQLVGQSDVWSMRIDIVFDGVHRSWWVVYQRQSAGTSQPAGLKSAEWQCVQRLLIAETGT